MSTGGLFETGGDAPPANWWDKFYEYKIYKSYIAVKNIYQKPDFTIVKDTRPIDYYQKDGQTRKDDQTFVVRFSDGTTAKPFYRH